MHTQTCHSPARVRNQFALGLCAFLLTASAAVAAPVDGRVVAGQASISAQGDVTRIEQSSERAIINWRGFGIDAHETVQFRQPGASSATLNRVTGDQVSVLLGRMDANGQVLLINPHGVIIGNGAEINVGSFIASTANMSDENFLAGQLIFDEPGRPGAQVINEGLISAAESGLVALVAPHVQNDGVIRARLGRVVLGAGDTFTIDLHGDGLINLAVAPETAAALLGVSVDNAGTVDVAGGRAVLMTAADASGVVDGVINMSGTVLASSAEQVGGRIVLAGEGADIHVSGTLDASGALGGGSIEIGGAWQGGGATPRAASTTVTETAHIDVSATQAGDAGEAVLWSDRHTAFAGEILARGGSLAGNGGLVEVSGLQTLDFGGYVDSSAANGLAGLLLLDPAILTVLAADASLLSLVLSNGSAVTLSATDTININAVIDGRGKVAGGSLTLNAGNHININDFIVTNNGAINLNATAGNIGFAAGKALFAGSAPITALAGGNITSGPMITTGLLNLRSTGGNVTVAAPITQTNRDVMIRAALDIIVNQPIVSFLNGSDLDLVADTGNITINAQVDGRDGVAGGSGAVTLTAGNNILLNNSVLSDGGNITVNAGGTFSAGGAFGLFADTAPISVTAAGDITTMAMITSGLLSVESTAGSIIVDAAINELNGNVSLLAANNLTINQPLVNFLNGSSLSLVATGGNLAVNAQIDGRDIAMDPAVSGPLTLTAGGDFLLNDNIITENAPLTVSAGGAFTPTGSNGLYAGNAPITVTAGGNLTTSPMVTSGDVTARSTGGTLTVATGIDETYGNVSLRSDGDLVVNQGIVNFSNGSTLGLQSDNGDVIVNAQIDGRDANGAPSSALTITAGQNIALNADVLTENADLTLIATNGTLTSTGGGLFTGSGNLSVVTGGNLNTGIFGTTGTLAMRSTAGSLTVDQKIAETVGNVTLRAATDLNVNSEIANIRTGSSLLLTADTGDININDRIDAQDDLATAAVPVAGGSVTLQAGNDINLNETITTFEGAVTATATNGTLNIATVAAPDYTRRIQVVDAAGDPGTAPITITTGGNLSTGAPIPGTVALDATCPACVTNDDHTAFQAELLAPFVALSTLGSLSLTSTSGDVSIDAPLPQTLGAVTLVGGNAVIINNQVHTADQPISITAGAGGVTVNSIDMGDFFSTSVLDTPLLFSGTANLTIHSVGDINHIDGQGLSTHADATLTSTAGGIFGTMDGPESYPNPANLFLNAFGNIDVYAGFASNIEATSSNGFIDIGVSSPGRLRLTTLTAAPDTEPLLAAGDIRSGGWMGPDVGINAARDIDLNGVEFTDVITLVAGRDILLDDFVVEQLTATAGRNFVDEVTSAFGIATMIIEGSADTVITATNGSVLFLGEASLLAPAASDILISAGDSVLLNQMQTTGGVSVTAVNGGITLNYGIGVPLTVDPSLTAIDPLNLGVEFLTLQANGAGGFITMLGANSFGLIDIDTSGLLTTTEKIVSTSLAVNPLTIFAGDGTIGDEVNAGPFSFAGTQFGDNAWSAQAQLGVPFPIAPALSPGPPVNPPAPPPAVSALPPADPGGISVAGLTDPGGGAVGATGEPGDLNLNSLPAPAAGGSGIGGGDVNNEAETGSTVVPPGPGDSEGESSGSGSLLIGQGDNWELSEITVFEGGSGAAADADLGQSGSYSVSGAPDGEDGESGDGDACTDEEDCEDS